jgi:hypothetical protein
MYAFVCTHISVMICTSTSTWDVSSTSPIGIICCGVPAGQAYMAIKDWHWGKLVLCWVAGLAASYGGFLLASQQRPADPSVALVLTMVCVMVVTVAIPIILFVLTWKWLSGKEQTG